MKKALVKKGISIIISFAILFSGIPALTGSIEADAAASYWKNLKVLSTTISKNTIAWKKLTAKQRKKISGIAVYRGTTTKNMKLLKRIKKSSKKFVDTKAMPGEKYYYRLKTYTKKKKSYKYRNSSPVKCVTTKKLGSNIDQLSDNDQIPDNNQLPETGEVTAPGKITGLRVTGIGTNDYGNKYIYIEWDKLSENVTCYEIYLNGDLCCSVGAGNDNYRINNVLDNTNYTISIRACLKPCNSSAIYGEFTSISYIIADATPDSITGLKVVSVNGDSIKLTWDKLTNNVTGYVITLNGTYIRTITSNTNTVTLKYLESNTTYEIGVKAYFDGVKRNYGESSTITATTNNEPSEEYISTFEYTALKPSSLGGKSLELGDGTSVTNQMNPRLMPLVQSWMDANLPEDATDAEKVNLCKKAFYELVRSPESIEIVGDPDTYWEGNSKCIRIASYFDTCAYAAGLYSGSRLCKYDEDYGVGFLRNHVNNFVWVDGKGYIVNLNTSGSTSDIISLINYDWEEWHIVPYSTSFPCRYY